MKLLFSVKLRGNGNIKKENETTPPCLSFTISEFLSLLVLEIEEKWYSVLQNSLYTSCLFPLYNFRAPSIVLAWFTHQWSHYDLPQEESSPPCHIPICFLSFYLVSEFVKSINESPDQSALVYSWNFCSEGNTWQTKGIGFCGVYYLF